MANRLFDLWSANRRLYGAEKLWIAALEADIPVVAELSARRDELTTHRDQLTAQLRAHVPELPSRDLLDVIRAEIEHVISRGSPDDVKQLFAELIDRVEISPDRHAYPYLWVPDARSPGHSMPGLLPGPRFVSGVEELVRAYEHGMTVNELAERFRVHRSTVLDHLNRSTARRRNPALDGRRVELARKLYESGLSLRDLGLTLNVHASTVRLALVKSGVPMRSRHGAPAANPTS